jgi:hypothetical protein
LFCLSLPDCPEESRLSSTRRRPKRITVMHKRPSGFCLTVDYNDVLQSFQKAILAPGDTRHRMSFSLHHPGRQERWLLLALALVFQGNVVSADSVSSPAFDAEAHAQVCKCGPRCRQASCCCGRPSVAEREDRVAPPTSTPHADFVSSAPCLEEAPCGDSGLPPTAGPRLQEKAATLAECVSRGTLMGEQKKGRS